MQHVSRRIYLHGDLVTTGQAYCRCCERFEAPQHFREVHDSESNIDIYRRGLAALKQLEEWGRVMPSARANMFQSAADEQAVDDWS